MKEVAATTKIHRRKAFPVTCRTSRPSFITRALLNDGCRFRVWQVRRARSPQFAQAPSALMSGSCSPDLLLERMQLARRTLAILKTFSAGAFVVTGSFIIFNSNWGKREPRSLRYTITRNCPMGADGGHRQGRAQDCGRRQDEGHLASHRHCGSYRSAGHSIRAVRRDPAKPRANALIAHFAQFHARLLRSPPRELGA